MAGNSGAPGRTVTSKLAAILLAFVNGSDHTLSELAAQTDLAVSTVHRLLTDLVDASLLERPDGTVYRPGPTLRSLPCTIKPPTLRARAPFIVEDVASSLQATVRLGVVDGLEVAYVEKKAGPEAGTLFPNPARLPLHATAMGKVLLAFGRRRLDQVIRSSPLTRYTPKTLTHPAELDRALQQIRARGVAVADGEHHPATTAMAVPVFDVDGRVVAAIEADVSGTGPGAVGLVVPALLTAARCLRRELAPPQAVQRWVGPPEPVGTTGPVRLRA
jgi:IclR family transcriptional regulator, acetate operon repressor